MRSLGIATELRALALVCLTLTAAACGGTGAEQTAGGVGPTGSGSGAGSGSGGGGGGGSGSGGGSAGTCEAVPACDAAPPDAGPKLPWTNDAPSGDANHRGRDLLLNPGDPQWIIAKFAYGTITGNPFTFDNDLEGEQVDIWLLRGCGSKWELLGSAITTNDDAFGNGPHDPVEGVEDDGGRVYFEIPAAKALGVGRHRVHLVVRGDQSSTELTLQVVPPGTPIVVTDVDGTITESEYIEFEALLAGELPPVHVDAAGVFDILASKGYLPMYLTARPEWLGQRTRDVLAMNGFPPGIVHTTTSDTGAVGGSASEFKTGELAVLKKRGMVPAFAFGNTETDAEAYDNGGIQPIDRRVFYQFDDTVFGGRRIESYTELLEEYAKEPDAVCP